MAQKRSLSLRIPIHFTPLPGCTAAGALQRAGFTKRLIPENYLTLREHNTDVFRKKA